MKQPRPGPEFCFRQDTLEPSTTSIQPSPAPSMTHRRPRTVGAARCAHDRWLWWFQRLKISGNGIWKGSKRRPNVHEQSWRTTVAAVIFLSGRSRLRWSDSHVLARLIIHARVHLRPRSAQKLVNQATRRRSGRPNLVHTLRRHPKRRHLANLKPNVLVIGENIGGLGGTRTPGALLRTEALYPLSYKAAIGIYFSSMPSDCVCNLD